MYFLTTDIILVIGLVISTKKLGQVQLDNVLSNVSYGSESQILMSINDLEFVYFTLYTYTTRAEILDLSKKHIFKHEVNE